MKKLVALSLLSCSLLALCFSATDRPRERVVTADDHTASRKELSLKQSLQVTSFTYHKLSLEPAILPVATEVSVPVTGTPAHAHAKEGSKATLSRELPKNKGPAGRNYAQSYSMAFS